MIARPMQTIISTCQVNQMRGSRLLTNERGNFGRYARCHGSYCFVMAVATWQS